MLLREGFVGVNFFGFGGLNVYVILKFFDVKRENNYKVLNVKRLFVYFSRIFDGVKKILNMV